MQTYIPNNIMVYLGCKECMVLPDGSHGMPNGMKQILEERGVNMSS